MSFDATSFYKVCIEVPVFPGVNTVADLSEGFLDSDLANYALANIRKAFPQAYLSEYVYLDGKKSTVEAIKYRDQNYKEIYKL